MKRTRSNRGSPAPYRRLLAALGFAIACMLIGLFLGARYISRLPDHAGYFLVGVDDEVRAPIPRRPRHTAVIVVDGLRRDAAETMRVTQRLQQAGQCRTSDQGSYTISRPEYALLSTGLEVDRTGARNNELTAPLAAESVWQVARTSGLRVSGSSHLPWFQQLFPAGFDRFVVQDDLLADVFADETGALQDLDLFHPLYVDEVGHEHGAASPEYRAAVERVDGEIAGLLARMDLTQDLVVLTADHGHTATGGHGGAAPELKDVLICFAGPGVQRRADRAAFDGRSTAPTLAVLLGLRFPRHMHAGDDDLDVIGEVVSAEPGNAAYLLERRAAVERFRAENGRALESWLGGPPGTWARLYQRESGAQHRRALLVGLMLFIVGVATLRARRMRARASAVTLAWLILAVFSIWAVHRAVLGEFDYTVINLRERFLPRAAIIGFGAALVGLGAHLGVVRARERLLGDFLMLVGLVLAANVGHVLVYGWPLGFPLPAPAARYFPFLGAILLVTHGLVAFLLASHGLVVSVRVALEHRRAAQSPQPGD